MGNAVALLVILANSSSVEMRMRGAGGFFLKSGAPFSVRTGHSPVRTRFSKRGPVSPSRAISKERSTCSLLLSLQGAHSLGSRALPRQPRTHCALGGPVVGVGGCLQAGSHWTRDAFGGRATRDRSELRWSRRCDDGGVRCSLMQRDPAPVTACRGWPQRLCGFNPTGSRALVQRTIR